MKGKLTRAQERVLAVLTDTPQSALDVATIISGGLYPNAGGAAGSLRVLVRLGLVDVTELGKVSRGMRYGYRRRQPVD